MMKNHPLHRPTEMYFTDKKEQQQNDAGYVSEIEKAQRQKELQVWLR